MAAIPHFGAAVHAVLVHLKTFKNDPLHNLRGRAYSQIDALQHALPIMPLLNDEAIARIIETWSIICHLVLEAENFQTEPTLPNQTVPDLVLHMPGNNLWIVEIKTHQNLQKIGQATFTCKKSKLWNRQVRKACTGLKLAQRRAFVRGFILAFDSNMEKPKQPLWREVPY